jgi:hypothetical protein
MDAPTLTAQWCLVDEVPDVPTGDDHTKMHIYGAVAPLTGRTHYHISPELGTGEFVKFLQHLLAANPRKRLLVIHDRGAQHKGAAIEEITREADGRLMLKAQPAYSPALNPQERIWKWLRRVVTHNHWFETLREQIEAIRNFFRYIAGVKTQVQRLCGLKTPESLVASLLGANLNRLSFEERQAVAHCLISKVVVTGEQVDISYVLPFEGAPRVADRPGHTPEGMPGHVYRLRLAHRDLRTPPIESPDFHDRQRQALGGVVRGAVADDQDLEPTAQPANLGPLG